MADCPARGDIVWIDLHPQTGREIAKRRPALVLSPKPYNKKTRLCLLCPITSREKGYPFEVPVQAGDVSGAVLADQVKSLDWMARNATVAARAPASVLGETMARLMAVLS